MNNFVNFEGNLTKDPDYRQINETRDLAIFRIAVNERISKDYEETLYIDVNAWGYHVPYCKSVSLSKGDRVTVRGRLQERKWEDKEGNTRYSMVVVPNNFSKIVKPSKGESSTSSGSAKTSKTEELEVF
jgi:single-strand DNA-binding protein